MGTILIFIVFFDPAAGFMPDYSHPHWSTLLPLPLPCLLWLEQRTQRLFQQRSSGRSTASHQAYNAQWDNWTENNSPPGSPDSPTSTIPTHTPMTLSWQWGLKCCQSQRRPISKRSLHLGLVCANVRNYVFYIIFTYGPNSKIKNIHHFSRFSIQRPTNCRIHITPFFNHPPIAISIPLNEPTSTENCG